MKTTAEKIAVMQAFERGELIEYANPGESDWEAISIPAWDWHMWDYRVAPRPLECWSIVSDKGEILISCPTESRANGIKKPVGSRLVHMREVTP